MMFDMPCRGCGASEVELFLDLGAQPHCNRLIPPEAADRPEPRYPLRVGFCRACTLVQIDHTIPKEQMFCDYPYVSRTTRTLVAHFKDTADRLAASYALRPRELVVDIGSNDGTWLKQYRPHGVRVLGVDPAANVAAQAEANGIPTMVRFFNEDVAEEIVAISGHAQLVTAAGVFFHLEELHSVVKGIVRLIGPNGVFVVQAIYLGGMIDNLAFDQVYHEHLVYYTLKSLETLLARHGLEVFDVRLVPIHGGSIEAHVAWKGMRTARPSVAALRAEEPRRGYHRIETYHDFARSVRRLRDRLVTLLDEYYAAGKRVHAYGAPAKGATLLNSCGIGPDRIAAAEEKNPMKVGALMPGCRVPIIAEGGVRPDAYLVLAWNFLDEFVERERAYLDAGGEFIVPVPQLRVIARRKMAEAAA